MLNWRREGGDLIEAEEREWLKWKKVDIEPRLETGDARRLCGWSWRWRERLILEKLMSTV